MTWQYLAIRALLCFGVGVEALCCVGLLSMRTTFARLHFLGPATVLGATSIAAAVLVAEAGSQAGVKAVLIALCLLGASPLIAHAIAQAAYSRRFGSLQAPEDGERR